MTWKIWEITDNFKEVDTKVWNKYRNANGTFQKYFFMRRLLTRGKSHPQIIMSMIGEYAVLLMILNWLNIKPTITIQMVGLTILLASLFIVGFLDILFEVDRKESSWNSRFNPEAQQLYRQVQEIHNKLFRGETNGMVKTIETQHEGEKELRKASGKIQQERESNALAHLLKRPTRIVLRPR